MDKYVERVCCREVPESVRRLCEAVTQYDDINMPLDCITEHPGFQLNCLRWEVLENAWLAYKQQYGAQAYDHNHLHKRYRHVAYRQLARFLFGIVGKENRYALPSCAVNAIRLTFPSPNNQYTGYDTGYWLQYARLTLECSADKNSILFHIGIQARVSRLVSLSDFSWIVRAGMQVCHRRMPLFWTVKFHFECSGK